MTRPIHQKVTASHLRRDASLYVRQSPVRQVFEHTESTRRQSALRERAVALGWPIERVNVIDSDLGKSGASAADREGFQKLVGEVGMGRAGIVLGLEVSRLARNSTDWHRLLEICAWWRIRWELSMPMRCLVVMNSCLRRPPVPWTWSSLACPRP